MIDINLLPDHLRRTEGTPLARQLTIYIGAAVWAGLLFGNIFFYRQNEGAEEKLVQMEAQVKAAKTSEERLKEVQGRIAGIKGHVEAVEDLYRMRVVWAKILMGIKQIVNKQGFNESNDATEYLWFEKLGVKEARSTVRGQAPTLQLTLAGYATASGEKADRVATQMFVNMMDDMKSYKPEDDDRKKRYEELLQQKEEREKKAAEQTAAAAAPGGAPAPSAGKGALASTEVELQRKAEERLLEHLKHESGGIAQKGFWDFFTGLTPKTEWREGLSSEKTDKKTGKTNLPLAGMNFSLQLDLKPPYVKPAASKVTKGR